MPALPTNLKQNKAKVLFSLFVIAALLISGYHIYYGRKIIPGVYIGSVYVGGLTYDEAVAKVSAAVDPLTAPVTFSHEDRKFPLHPTDINLEYHADAAVARAYEVGRAGNPFINTKDKIAGLVGKKLWISAMPTYDESALNVYFSTVVGAVDLAPIDARYAFGTEEVLTEDGTATIQQENQVGASSLVILPDKDGLRVDKDALYKQTVYALERLEFIEYELKVDVAAPTVRQTDLESIFPVVEKLVDEEIVLTGVNGNVVAELSSEELLSFITVDKESADSAQSENTTEILPAVYKPAVEAYAATIAQQVNQLPRGRITEMQNDVVTGFEFIEEGYELNEANLADSLEKELKTAFANPDSYSPNNIELEFTTIEGEADPKKYGIYALLGEGTSRFTGSAGSRVHNLTLAAARIDGVMVAPGEVFSFNNSVGPISSATGYTTAYVISNGRTVLGDGGGVCQTSTTMFRAALNAGLPIVRRNPHAYRVLYYELDSAPGIDASIYQPSLDFQFLNDTQNYVLIQADWSEADTWLSFKLYGTPDGREVTITEPVVTNETPPPAPKYEDDPSLPKGVTRQVDFSAWGATASFGRVVERDGEILHQDTFTTHYQPWQAVFLVGTAE